MTVHPQLTIREARIAEEMTRVLDWLSRTIQGLDQGNVAYAEEKAWHLMDAVEALHRQLDGAVKNAGQEPAVRSEMVKAAITDSARHYAAGRALYPAEGGAR